MSKNENPKAHQFGGIDGRCFNCDVRPHSRAAAAGCDDYTVAPAFHVPSTEDWDFFHEVSYVDPAELDDRPFGRMGIDFGFDY